MNFCKVRDVKTPTYGTPGSAGIDFYVPNFDRPIVIHKHSDVLIPSGIKMDIPKGYMLIGADKSGVVTSTLAKALAGLPKRVDSFDSSIIIGAKVIDEDYTDEIHIHLINTGDTNVIVKPGMKIAQFILVPVLHEELNEISVTDFNYKKTERKGGFGSTGRY